MDGLVELANKTFNLYRCSPLFSFDNDTRSSRNKPRSLALFLCSGLQLSIAGKTIQQSSRGEIKDVRFEHASIPEITFYDRHVKPLKLTIQLRFTKDKADTQHIFLLLPATVQSTHSPDFTYFPVMLAKAKNIVTTEVMEWLKKNYACHISPLPIPSPTFHSVIKTWVTTLFELAPLEDELVKAPTRNVQHALEIEYVIHDLKELANITLKLKIPEVMKMCKRLKDPKDFIFALQDHILHITKINVGALAIGKLTTTNMGLDKEGRLKIFGHISRMDAVKIVCELIELASTK
ncbi:hypothetical protein G6F55_009147 [Rhizopus delemar]|nr:hypothetical protein G6F55_009147 [Rhizopus delemar]KAG1513417.1 hypothetical protein G6F52_010168 [Rhizopus delemar]KAG1594456.1 hypothetical protein G6F47_008787 [Rhizopus delemar]KAG1624656.1 hypothetical protein G6F45_009839 [Rhizopus arrhizus]